MEYYLFKRLWFFNYRRGKQFFKNMKMVTYTYDDKSDEALI